MQYRSLGEMSHEDCIAIDLNITREMELAGAATLESYTGALDEYSLVKAVYTAMVRSSRLAPSQGLSPDQQMAR